MKQVLISNAIVLVLFLLRLPFAKNVFAKWWAKLPKWSQPALPVVLGIWAQAILSYDSGVRGEALFEAALSGWQYGVYAIGFWHAMKRLPKKASSVATGFFLFLVLFGQNGCNSATLQIQKALVFEQQIQSEASELRSIAHTAIRTMPEAKQAEFSSELDGRFAQLTELLAKKDQILQAALEASESPSLSQVAVQIAEALSGIISLLETKAAIPRALLEPVAARSQSLRLQAGRL